jgi:hypothetical protein
MPGCKIHVDFFDEKCLDCKQEYAELKGHVLSEGNDDHGNQKTLSYPKKYKDFSEGRAKRLYEQLLIQFLSPPDSLTEVDAARKACSIIKKQCLIRGIPIWEWLK